MYLNLQLVVIFLITQDVYAQLVMYPIEGSCRTPSGKSGTCINLKTCPTLMKIIGQERPISESSIDLLRKSHCGFEGKDPKVCCENKVTTTISPTTEKSTTESEAPTFVPNPPDVKNHKNLKLLDLEICGPITEQKIFGGNKTGVLDFPWMALIAYKIGTTNNVEFRCGGSVITKRYILTAAHCVTDLPNSIVPFGVRVGDHDINKERDCDVDKNGLEIVCAEKYQDFGIESTHHHPRYSRTDLQNDVALIRLNKDIDFRPASAKPICLPISPATSTTTKKVIATGWGITENRTRSNALLQVKLSQVSNEKCAEAYKNFAVVGYKQMCAGGKDGMDTCLGDSGGPLQAIILYNERDARFVQFGIVSFGLKSCGIEGFPGVYTRVAYFMDWILDTMKD